MVHQHNKPRNLFLKPLQGLFEQFVPCQDIVLEHNLKLRRKKIRLPNSVLPLQILLGGETGKRLFLYPELKFDVNGRLVATDAYLLFDAERFFIGISGFIRLVPGDSIILGRDSETQNTLLQYPKVVANRHLKLQFPDTDLLLKDTSFKRGTCIEPLLSSQDANNLEDWRQENIERFVRLFPNKLEPLPADQALELIDAVIEDMQQDPAQPFDTADIPGGVVQLPVDMETIIVGDLHARVDNLLVILTQNRFLQGLEGGNTILVILGDAVHPDEEGKEHEMKTSVLIMDLILQLKLKFPRQVYYIRGNHDSFSEDISKQGISQGLLWQKELLEERGNAYLQSMNRLYRNLPYVVMSDKLLACHAGAPTSKKVSIQQLVNVKQSPQLETQLVTIRMQRPNRLNGYNPTDIKHLRLQLKLPPETPFIVGHTPLSDDDTLWWNANKIPNHHVVFGAHPHWVGVIVQSGNQIYPLRYPAEPLVDTINRLIDGSADSK